MNNHHLWSLRLGFSGKQSSQIEKYGIENFVKQSIAYEPSKSLPDFLVDEPKTMAELQKVRMQLKNLASDEAKQIIKQQIKVSIELRKWWLHKIMIEPMPLREKMTCFWHNHFVATLQKVKVNYWVYQHNEILREHAFGNFKELTKKVLKTNAMVRYLDNTDNKKGKINENLSRELLELFTLGIGNYSETDIKNGAKALAGLGIGEEEAVYRRFQEDNDEITYFGNTGKFKADELVDIIFEQKNIPFLITRKILKWFIYDNPSEELVIYYGNYFKQQNFEIKPLLIKMFTEEYSKNTAGNKIKDPMVYIFQLIDELNIKNPDLNFITFFLKEQGMDLMNQPNVKGWEGGTNWMTSQVYLQRNNISDLLCSGKNINQKIFKEIDKNRKISFEKIDINLKWNKAGNNKQIIADLTDRLLFKVDEPLQRDLESLLKYDFNPNSPGANNAVLRLFNSITKTPEFQLI